MRFLMLIHEAPSVDAGPPPVALIEAVGAFRADTTHGEWLDDGGLAPVADALRVRTDHGRATVLDGPFAEAKEVIGGFFVIESPSADSMVLWAKAFTDLHAEHWPELSYTAEIRQIVDPTT
jgi:hypothetical protein